MIERTCTHGDCKEPHCALGYCARHYEQFGRVRKDAALIVHRKRPHRKYALNEAYFDEIATEEQAYWLGFITADGCIVQSSSKSYCLRVLLALIDRDHVQRFADALGSGKPIYTTRRGEVGAAIDSRHMTEALGRLGVGPRKSLTAEPWDGPPHLMPHYWRGMFDGDGTIFKGKTSPGEHWIVSLLGSRACIDAYRAWAAPISGGHSKPTLMKGGVWRWKAEGGPSPQRLARALYGDATISLPRKQQSANTLCAIDYEALRIVANAARRASMQDAWATGRHPRAKR